MAVSNETTTDKKNVLIFIILAITTIIFYFPSLWYKFMFDDFPYILQNIHIRNFIPQNIIFKQPRWISLLLSQISFKIGGLHPLAYRLPNLFTKNLSQLTHLKQNTYII